MARPRPVPWLRAHPRAADGLLAAVVGLVSVIVHLTARLPDVAQPSAIGAVLVAASSFPIAWRRRAPVALLAWVTAVEAVIQLLQIQGSGVGHLITIYSIGSVMTADRRRTTVVTVAAVAAALFLVPLTVVGRLAVGDLIASAVVYPSAFVLGDNLRRRRERLADLAERAERTEREQELLARERVNEERSRIARELHDVVAHSVSVMVIQAGAARRQLATDPARATLALENIETTGRQAMQEMRRILGVLRADSDPAELAPQPSLASIDALVRSDDSLPAHLVVEGEPVTVPVGVELSAYRVVQEALTNVRKHAGGCTAVTVALRFDAAALDVEVIDDGHGAAAALGGGGPGDGGTGHGLIGMRERVAACGGELKVGPRVGGGWRVRAHFPLSGTGVRP